LYNPFILLTERQIERRPWSRNYRDHQATTSEPNYLISEGTIIAHRSDSPSGKPLSKNRANNEM
jgi:hypothetical protein